MNLAIRTYAFLAVTVADLKSRLTEDRGQTAVEYILVLVLVGAIIVALFGAGVVGRATTAIQNAIADLFDSTPT